MSEFHDNSIVELLTTTARLRKLIHHADIVHPKREAWITEVLETIDLLKREFDFPEIYDALETISVPDGSLLLRATIFESLLFNYFRLLL